LCQNILARLDAQYVKGKAARTKRAIDMLCGAGVALDAAKSEHTQGVLVLAVLVSARGIGTVENVAETGEL
jgi:hypothetical protein